MRAKGMIPAMIILLLKMHISYRPDKFLMTFLFLTFQNK